MTDLFHSFLHFMTFSPQLETNNVLQCSSDSFPCMVIYILSVENCQNYISLHSCLPITRRLFFIVGPFYGPRIWECNFGNLVIALITIPTLMTMIILTTIIYLMNLIILIIMVNFKGELLFSSVGPVKLIHGHWLHSTTKMHHILAQYMFGGIFGFVCAGFSKKYL